MASEAMPSTAEQPNVMTEHDQLCMRLSGWNQQSIEKLIDNQDVPGMYFCFIYLFGHRLYFIAGLLIIIHDFIKHKFEGVNQHS